jgi:hypothetical protein
MNKFIIITFLVLSMVGCSKNNENNEQPDISLNAGVGVVTGSGDFGSMGPKDSKILSVRITNSGDAPLVGPPSIDNNNFSIIYQSGCASIAPGRRCDLKISFNAVGKPFQTFNGNLNLDSAFLALSATILDPNPSQVYSVSFSPISPLNFGTITDKQSIIKTLIIRNTGTTTIENQAVVLQTTNYSILSDSCSNKIIAPNRTCTLRISLNGTGKSGPINDLLSFGGPNIQLNGIVVSSSGASELGSPNVQLLVDNAVSTSADFGSLEGNQSKQIIVVAKNNGNKASDASVAQLLSNANFSIAFNQCHNRSLNPGVSCQMRLVFSAAGKTPAQYSDTLTYAGQSLNLMGSITAPIVACSLSNSISNGIDISGVTSVAGNTPNCVVAACNETTHTLYGLGSMSKRCATLEKIYQLQELSLNNQIRDTEYIWANAPFGIAWFYRNQSYAKVDGVRAYDLEIDVPYPSNFLNIVFPFSGANLTGVGLVQSCSLKPLGKIEANGYCSIIMANDQAPHPTGFSVVSPYSGSYNVQSSQSNQTFINYYTYRKLLPTTVAKTAIAAVVRQGIDPGAAEGLDNTPRGITLSKMNLSNDQVEYIGPCRTKPDGSSGDPRGLFPWTSEGNVRPIKTIGTKVFFSGRGCSSTGSGISYEKWGLWEYDSTQAQSVSNPRRISRSLTQLGNYIFDEAPREDMLVLNNKLYYSAVSMIGGEVNEFGDFRRALFEYDPSIPLQNNQLLPNPNPKEILTGYERDISNNIGGSSSYPASITSHNGKIYFLGVYFRDTSPTSGIREYHNGVLSYNPAVALNNGDLTVLETTDNPRFEWGYEESKYSLWQFDSWPSTNLFVDDNYFVFGAKMPRSANPVNNEFDTVAYPGGFANFDAFLAQLRDDRGQEITFVHRLTGNIHKPDLCPGICDGRPNLVTKVGNYYLFVSLIDGVEDNKQVFAALPTGSPDGSLTVQAFNSNPTGRDIRSDRWNFAINVIGTKAYFPLIPEDGKSSMYEFDSTTGNLTRLMFGNLEGKSTSAFAIAQQMQNGDILMRGQFTDSTAMVYSTSQPVAGTASNVINSNPYQKASGAFWYGFKEDANFYYYLRNANCPTGGLATAYVDYSTKNRDANLVLYNHPRYDNSRCNGEYRYRGESFILLNNN